MEDTILQTAEQLFLEKGFEGTSTTEIAKRVGCNQALVHYYFRTKQNLFSTIFEKKFLTLYNGFMDMEALENRPFNDKVRFFIETHFDLISKDPRLPSLVLNEFHRLPHLVSAIREKLQTKPNEMILKFEAELQDSVQKGLIRPISLLDLAISIISLNISLLIMLPVLEILLPLDEDQKAALLAHRRAENVDFVLKSLRP